MNGKNKNLVTHSVPLFKGLFLFRFLVITPRAHFFFTVKTRKKERKRKKRENFISLLRVIRFRVII